MNPEDVNSAARLRCRIALHDAMTGFRSHRPAPPAPSIRMFILFGMGTPGADNRGSTSCSSGLELIACLACCAVFGRLTA